MEIQILKQVHRIECGKISADFSLRESVVPLITADDDVQFYWSLISAGWEPDIEKKILSMVTDLWITVRGFSYANGWIERHKRETESTIQKTKASENIYLVNHTCIIIAIRKINFNVL